MPASLTNTTELEAINEMLEVIGEAPINTLDLTGRADVTIAKNMLYRETRRFCERGWFWNTDEAFILSLNTDNKIPVPTNALRVDPCDTSVNVTVRGAFLWNRDTNTAVFTDSIKCDIVRHLPYDDLIEPARTWVVAMAMRTFAKRILGDETVVVYTNEDIETALIAVEKAEDNAADHSLYQDADTLSVIGRNRNYRG
jgi:hypothetical protein